MPEWMVKILEAYGLAGLVIAALGVACYHLYSKNESTNTSRLAERDVLIKALGDNTTAVRDNARVMEERNKVTEQLADAMEKLATAFEMFSHKAEMHHENVREKLQDQKLVIDASAEANRVNTGVLRDIRTIMERIEKRVQV